MNAQDHFNIAIIGGGILGTSIAYFLASSSAPQSSNNILLIEQEQNVSLHASARNTGKVHAPFLYDPIKKKLFAKAAFLGFNMLKEYCSLKSLPFKQDGVLEVATYEKALDRLHKYLEWGYSNGLAHGMKMAGEYTDLHFRGEYWQVPPEYRDLTNLSIYTVPKYPEYPFFRSSLGSTC